MMHSDESMANRNTEFWGICCEGGKKYSQVVRQRFHMTMAALDPTVVPTSPVVSLMVDRGGCEYLLCSLKPGTLLQVNLNLYFDKGEKVTFSLIGKGKIHLSGYHIYEKIDSVPAPNKEKEIKNPSQSNAASASSSQTDKKVKLAVKESDDSSDVEEISNNKSKGKTAIPKKILEKMKKSENNESEDDESDEDSSEDEDFSDDSDEITEDNKKDSKRLQSYKRAWSALANGDDEENESDSEDSDEDDEESPKNIEKQFQNKKRQKNETTVTTVNKESEKSTPGKKSVKDSKLLNKFPKEDLLNSSIGRTPMPKTPKDNLMNSSKTVTPKKVEFMDIESSDSDNEKDTSSLKATKITEPTTPSKEAQPTTPSSESKKKKKKKKNKASLDATNPSNETPAKPKGIAGASYNQKLPGGLEYEDIRVGNGPIAKKGRLVHVYYTGMLENNKVFDSKEVGSKPFSFRLGGNQVIKGWDLGIEGMKVGGKRRMKIPPKLGYASTRAGVIPPNSTLYFTVELKAVS